MSLIKLFRRSGWAIHYASPALRGEHGDALKDIQSHEIRVNCSSFDSFILGLKPHMVLFDRFMMEEQFGWRVEKNCPDALRVLDMEDMHSLRLSRQEAVKKGRSYHEANFINDQAKREVAAIFRSDITLVISEVEMEILQREYRVPPSLLEYCPFMLEQYQGKVFGYEERRHFISIGNFRHAPNWDSVLQLKEKIWPEIHKVLPETQLHIYGAYPPPKATQLNNEREGFLVKGWAEDSRKVMSNARVCLAPLRFGAGLKGKLAEAMVCGTPSVTSEIGAEGMHGELPWPGMITEDIEDISEAAISLYSNKALWERMQEKGRDILSQRFDTEKTVKRVKERVECTLQSLTSHRQKNFIGVMLQHQTMKATQYMSQWIEEKNRNMS